jgi:SpoIID/LytB domain protein
MEFVGVNTQHVVGSGFQTLLPGLFHQVFRWSTTMIGATAGVTMAFTGIAPVQAQTVQEPVLDVGIVQRFGEEPTDKITLEPLSGDRLTVQFETGDRQDTVTATSIKLEITMKPLPAEEVRERVVLSTHRSFESAEDSANQWREKGIDVEIAQPRQWQVWADRDTYATPLLRRLLMQNLQSHGAQTAFLDTQVITAEPQATLLINGYRYERDEVRITSGNARAFVTLDEDRSTRTLYGGHFQLQPNAYGNYTLVNQVPIETYLRGVVPHEIGLAAPRTTIEAQAILARTYALRNLRRFAIDDYQLCADTQCQVYKGLSGAADVTDRAIVATRGLVLTYQDELVDALYSSTTGGITAPFADVWNGPNRPYLRAVVDAVNNLWDLERFPLSDEANFRRFISLSDGFNENGWDVFRWRVEDPLADMAADLRRYLQSKQHPQASFQELIRVEVVERSNAGRVQRVRVETDRGELFLEKDEILRAFYAPNSTLFYLEPMYEEVTPPNPNPAVDNPATGQESAPENPIPERILKGYAFVGGGLGHGVGMSQTGAYRLGDLGWPNDRILSFYYPGTAVQPLSGRITFWRDPRTSEDEISQPPASELEAEATAPVTQE